MFLYDFHIFYLGGKAVLAGLSPYTVADFNGPFPLALIFVPFALLPETIAYILYVGICLYLLWRLMRLKSIWALLSFPVWFNLFVGQVDLPLALLASLGNPILLALALVKPQVAFVVWPFALHRMKKREWIQFGITLAIFLGLSFILRPQWVQEFLTHSPAIGDYSIRTSNLYWIIPASLMNARVWITLLFAGVALVVSFWVRDRRLNWSLLQLFAPLSNIYSAAMLAEWIGPIEVLLSWIVVFLMEGKIHSGMPMFVVGLSIIFRHLFVKKLENQPEQSRSMMWVQKLMK